MYRMAGFFLLLAFDLEKLCRSQFVDPEPLVNFLIFYGVSPLFLSRSFSFISPALSHCPLYVVRRKRNGWCVMQAVGGAHSVTLGRLSSCRPSAFAPV